jgi:acetyltransferase-like isoleucine patch superfamily enzyme
MMKFSSYKPPKSHGDGKVHISDFAHFGSNSVMESSVLVFHPENIVIGQHVYIGHYAILNGYHAGHLNIGEGSWIGPQTFLHAAGGIEIGKRVGIGPGVKILTSIHDAGSLEMPVMDASLVFGKVTIEDGADLGTGAVILPGVSIGQGAIIGAGAVVNANVEPWSVYAGVPAKLIKRR